MGAVDRNDYDIQHAQITVWCRKCNSQIELEMDFEPEPTVCKCGREWHFRAEAWACEEAEGE